MKAKEYIIQKLVEAGKRHRWMKYPMLALVSLISFFFLVLEKCMERPKRAVIVLVCMVLIISQGWYLISLAEEEANHGPESVAQGPDAADSTDINMISPDDPSADTDGIDQMAPVGADASQGQRADDLPYMITLNANDPNFPDIIYGSIGSYSQPDFNASSEYQLVPAIPSDSHLWEYAGWYVQGRPDVVFNIGTPLTKDDWLAYGTTNENAHFLYLSANWKRIGYKITYMNGASVLDSDYVSLTDGAATCNLKTFDSLSVKPVKTGYHFIGWTIDTINYTEDQEIIFGNGGYNKDVIVTPQWEANTYTIEFTTGVTDDSVTGTMPSIECTYDKNVSLPVPDPDNGGFGREGYSFVGWKLLSNGYIYTPGVDFTVRNLTAENHGIVTLEAQWVYNVAGLPSEYKFTYGEEVAKTAEVRRQVENGEARFAVTLTDVSGETTDGITLNKTNYTDVTGLYVNPASTDGEGWAGFDLITKDKNGIRTTGKLVLQFTVEDLNNPVDENGDSTTVYPIVTIYLNPKPLTITGVENASKTYDGSTIIGVGRIQFEGKVLDDDVRVYSEGQNGTFDDPNAGTGKSITLKLVLEGASAHYYKVQDEITLQGIGTINKRIAHVTTAPVYAENKDFILTGEEPEYSTIINMDDLPELVAAADEQIIQNSIRADAYTCDYKPGYQSGEFAIGIDPAKVELVNYELVVTPGTLRVEQEEPIEMINYEVIGSRLPGNLWYYDEAPRVTPTGKMADYDMVYITNDSSDRALTCDSRFGREMLVTEDLYVANKDTTLYIQLGKSGTGAVTSMVPIEIKVDTTAPVIDANNIEVRSANTGGFSKVANFLSFGNFFQESQVVTVPVTDNLSVAKNLTYWLGDNIWEDGIEIGIRNGKASFQIPMNYKGTIALIASDNAGNTTTKANLIGIEGGELWVIENQAPEVRVSAEDPAGNMVYSGEGRYYKSVTMTAEAKDLDSGIAYLIWNVTRDGEVITEDAKEYVSDRSQLLTSYDFKREFTESGTYTVSVTAYDNADNVSIPTTAYRFSVDGTAPEIQVSPADYDAEWSTEKTITFSLADKGSGIAMVTLEGPDYQPYPFTAVEGKNNAYTFTVKQKGTFTIRVADGAGNTRELPLEFTRVSSEVPDAPKVTTRPAVPQNAEGGWFTSNPEITITAPDSTPDGTKIFMYYRLWEEGTEEPGGSQDVNGSFRLPREGIWNLRAWTETEAGMKSASEEVLQLRYDETAPVISNIMVNGTGTAHKVSFQVTELPGCLVSLEAIYNNDEANAQKLGFTYAGNSVYTSGFTAAMKGSYRIKATDAAGNTAYADAFEPIHITVTGISGNVENGIIITGRAETGTFAIDSLTVKYGPAGQELTLDADNLLVTTDANGNKAFTAKFTQLSELSRYGFLITALTQNGESGYYTGVFKTGIRNGAGVNVAGTVHDETLVDNASTPLYIALYDGNDIVQYQSVKNNEAFMFTNLPDGVYMVRAMNGNRSVSMGLVIQGQKLVEPTGAIRLVLRSGQSTSVEYDGNGMPQVSVSGLENLFGDTTNFGSDQDYAVIDAGGSVEFCMLVKGMLESEVPASDMALLMQNLGSKERVAMYMDFSIWKRCIGVFGTISENQVTSISGGKKIRIVIPISDELAVQEGLSVLRVHGGTVERLADLDSNPNTYTIESTLFSTYALVYTDNSSNNDTTDDPGNNTSTENPGGSNTGTSNNGGATDISKTQNNNSLVSQANRSPQTGDRMPVVWISVLGAIVAAVGILLLKNKKNC